MVSAYPLTIPYMIDHIGIAVSDIETSRAFYTEALAPLGIGVIMEFPGAIGFGTDGHPFFWIMGTDQPVSPVHIAFSGSRGDIDTFYDLAIAAGGRDNGKP